MTALEGAEDRERSESAVAEWSGAHDNSLQKIRTWVKLAQWTIPRFPIASWASFRSAASEGPWGKTPYEKFLLDFPA